MTQPPRAALDTRRSIPGPARPSGLAFLLLAALWLAGCATTGSSTELGDSGPMTREPGQERKPPPEVTDHTVDERPGWARSVRPRVNVSMDEGWLEAADIAGYKETIRRGAVRCYQSSLRQHDTESEGAIIYEVIVTRNGYVAGADVMSTALKRDDVSRCVEHVISRIRFAIPDSGRPLYRLFFRVNFFLETLVPDEPPV